MSRRRIALVTSGSLAGLLLLAAVTAILVVRSDWFRAKVRAALIETIESATGGRAEIGDFRFAWRRLRVEVDQFVLHGSEPADRPPLARVASAAVGLKILSILKRDVDVEYLDITGTRIYLMVFPDGHTNVPEPKIKRPSGRTAVETLLNLAVGRFSVRSGLFEVEARGATPFEASGRNLSARFQYELAGPRYRGDMAIQPLSLQWAGLEPIPADVQIQLALERNRIDISSARITTGDSRVEFSGAVEDLASPRGSFRYQASASVMDVARILHLRNLERGTVQLEGSVDWAGSARYQLTGNLHAAGIAVRQDDIRLRNFRADGAVRADPQGVNVNGLRFTGDFSYTGNSFPVQGQVANVALRGSEANVRGLSLALLGGGFDANAAIENGNRFHVQGVIRGLEAKRAVAVYNSRQALPWNSLVSGPVSIEGSVRQRNDLRLSADLTLGPAPNGPAVSGEVRANYDVRAGTLDLGTSILNLPSSRAVVSGTLGRQMRVHLDSRDLDDFLPALGEKASSLPVKLQNGALTFDGTATGKLEDPQVDGRLGLRRFSYSGELFDSFQAEIAGTPRSVRLTNAALDRGTLHGEFQLALGLRNWKPDDSSSITASGTARNWPVADLLGLLHQTSLAASGTLTATAQIAGTIGSPQATGDVEVVKGSVDSEPFDRVAARVSYSGTTLQVAAGQLTAGAKQVRFDGSFDHTPNQYQTGHARFHVETNALPLDQIQWLARVRPGIAGTVQATARGEGDLAPSGFRLMNLMADATARDLQLAGQMLGNAHLTANSQGPVLRATIDSDFADSMLRGQGEWRLEGDYPGTATVSFARVDLAQLRAWIAPARSHGLTDLTGFAEGEVRVDGPLLKPQLLKAELRLPSLEIGPSPNQPLIPGARAAAFVLRNSGPIVATMANSTVTIESARLVGPSTDFTVGGKVQLDQKNPLDLRVAGRVDLAILQDFDHDITASGSATMDASLRGPLDSPQVNGRLEVQGASAAYTDLPNGISNASGTILFTGDRATVQSLTGETGGGKIKLTGFAGYGGNDLVFRLNAEAQAVRVRYPEGVSTIANANLNFTGTSARSMVSGTITILRSGLNLQSDFGSLLAKSAEPVRTPSAGAGFLGGLNFDVIIETSPDIQFESSLAQGVSADANLRLRGTASNPALLGRINITRGQIVFFGTKYVINQGSISFYNPVKVEPVLNVDLETKARGIDITLTVSGPLNRLSLTPRSDPALQFNEIVALLATGRTPTSDPSLLAQQGASAPSPFPQAAASALLGQVIANPVAGRLQRFFGISKLRIDPSLPGIEYNPQARLTLEQQVTPDLTFTYITNVTSANPQVVSVEWSVSRQWSVVALREENGLFGLDFFYKRRF